MYVLVADHNKLSEVDLDDVIFVNEEDAVSKMKAELERLGKTYEIKEEGVHKVFTSDSGGDLAHVIMR